MPTKKPLIGAAIVGQSGGPSSVINASAYGVIKTALEDENITKVYGAEHGIVADIELIRADQINEAWERMVKGDVKYRFVIDSSTLAG